MGKIVDFVDSSKGLHSKMFISYSVVSCPTIKIQYFLMKVYECIVLITIGTTKNRWETLLCLESQMLDC